MPGLLSHLIQRVLSPQQGLSPMLRPPFGAAPDEPSRPSLEGGEEVGSAAPLRSGSPVAPRAALPLSDAVGLEPLATRADQGGRSSLSTPSEHESPGGEPTHREQERVALPPLMSSERDVPDTLARNPPTMRAGLHPARVETTRAELERPREELAPPQDQLGQRLDALERALRELRSVRVGAQEGPAALESADGTPAALAPPARPEDVPSPLERLSPTESTAAFEAPTESRFRELAPLVEPQPRAVSRRREPDDTTLRTRPSELLESPAPLLRLSATPSLPLATPASTPPVAADHTIHISIGRVELRAAPPAPFVRAASSQAQPQLSLARYLDQRRGGRR